MARITGLTFIQPVKDLDKAVRFYTQVFELQVVFRTEGIAFVGSEGNDSAIGLLLSPETAGSGPQNVGPHVDHSINHDDSCREVEAAGGKVIERGEHAPGVPFARIQDPDGNEIWI